MCFLMDSPSITYDHVSAIYIYRKECRVLTHNRLTVHLGNTYLP